jgi:hypothetical protein
LKNLTDNYKASTPSRNYFSGMKQKKYLKKKFEKKKFEKKKFEKKKFEKKCEKKFIIRLYITDG